MTFDDGILKIYKMKDIAEPGKKPAPQLVLCSKHYFGYEIIGATRYYAAKQAQVQISNLVRIWQDRSVEAGNICILEDGKQYQCENVQHITQDGLGITKITLERLGKDYDISEHQ